MSCHKCRLKKLRSKGKRNKIKTIPSITSVKEDNDSKHLDVQKWTPVIHNNDPKIIIMSLESSLDKLSFQVNNTHNTECIRNIYFDHISKSNPDNKWLFNVCKQNQAFVTVNIKPGKSRVDYQLYLT